MNYLLRLCVILFFILIVQPSAIAQKLKEKEVPQTILESFKKDYPNIYVYKWKRNKKTGVIQAKYYDKGIKYKTYYDHNYNWLRTEREVKKEDVPQDVWINMAQSEYYSWNIDDLKELQTQKHDLIYEIEIKKKGKSSKRKVYLYYLPDGSLVNTKAKK